MSVLGAVTIGDDLELLQCIWRHLNHLVRKSLVGCAVGVVVQAVQNEIVELAAQAAHVEGRLPFRKPVGEPHARREQGERSAGAAIERQVNHCFVVDDLAAIARIRLENSGGFVHLHGLRHITHFKPHIHALMRAHVDTKTRRLDFLESRGRSRNAITANPYFEKLIVAALIGGCGLRGSAVDVLERKCGLRNGSTLGISYGSQHRSSFKLSRADAGNCEQTKDKQCSLASFERVHFRSIRASESKNNLKKHECHEKFILRA